METIWQDIRYGIRSLVKSPGFTVVVVLTLALGLGANSAIFSVVNAFLLRPLPVQNPEQLTVLGVKHEGNMDAHPISYLDYQDYRAHSEAFSDMSGFLLGFVGLSTGGRAERMVVSFVTPNYFTMLGLEPGLGRLILPSEGQKLGADPVLVLGYSYWQKRFGGDPNVVGMVVHVNGQPFTIVGVVPKRFHGTYAVAELDGYLPLDMNDLSGESKGFYTERDSHSLSVLGRLKPGVSLAQGQASLSVIAAQLEKQYPDTNKGATIHVYPENRSRPNPSNAESSPLLATVFLLLTGLVLLVACFNVANLLLVRATLRQKELAIRAALGAGRARLLRQLLTESVMLAVMGGAGGIALGWWASRLLGSIRIPGDLPFRFDFGVDWRVFGYVSAAALLTGVVVGLLPALRASRANLNETLREGGRGTSGGAERHRARNILVVAQVAGSVVLLVAAGLFVRSLRAAQNLDLGFRSQNVLNLSMDTSELGYDKTRGKTFYHELERRVRALPGVTSASLAATVPLGYNNESDYVSGEGQEVVPGKRRPTAGYNVVGSDYFPTMGIPIVKGRAFTAEDTETSRPVAIVNEFMARRFWPGQEAIGKRFTAAEQKGISLEVIGVCRDGKFTWIFDEPGMYFFLSNEQHFKPGRTLQVRTQIPPESMSPAIQAEIRTLAPDLPTYDVLTMEQVVQGPNGFFLLRMGALFAGALGGLGLLLAVVGVYGVVSYATSQRTHEIGIRMAIGAERGDILKMILRQGLVLVFIGLGMGLVAAFAVSRSVANYLFGISAKDPVTFGGVALILMLVAVVACFIPANRATRVDPMIALRYE
jgi:macrolide transport system ATP-binding/permease protein